MDKEALSQLGSKTWALIWGKLNLSTYSPACWHASISTTAQSMFVGQVCKAHLQHPPYKSVLFYIICVWSRHQSHSTLQNKKCHRPLFYPNTARFAPGHAGSAWQCWDCRIPISIFRPRCHLSSAILKTTKLPMATNGRIWLSDEPMGTMSQSITFVSSRHLDGWAVCPACYNNPEKLLAQTANALALT